MLGILRLPQEIKNDILNGYISMGHARVLSKLEDKEKCYNYVKELNLNIYLFMT